MRHTHTDRHALPTNGNFFDEHRNVLKKEMLQDYSRHMGYINLWNRMIKSYQVQHQTGSAQNPLHFLDKTFLNSFVI